MSDLKNNNQIIISGILGIPEIKSGFNIGEVICKYLKEKLHPHNGDIIVVAQKIISKAENCLVDLKSIEPTNEAKKISNITEKDPRLVQLILNNSKEIIKAKKGILIVETIYGYICANAGIDTSNLKEKDSVSFLPLNLDKSAEVIKESIKDFFGVEVAVIISDSFNRPWRKGSINVALGFSGLDPFVNLIGEKDDFGKPLKSTLVNVADEISSAAQLVMGENSRVPVALVRGYKYQKANSKGYEIFREKEKDLFR